MKKTYLSNGVKWVRIGKTLIKLDFKDGKYSTDNSLFQKAIENTEHFKNKVIKLV